MDNNRIEGSDLNLVFLSLSPLGIKLVKRSQLVKVFNPSGVRCALSLRSGSDYCMHIHVF